jgi:hypothetical protein
MRREGVSSAVASADSAAVFDWLLTSFSYQGISDRAAWSYMQEHGTASWAAMALAFEGSPATCTKLRSYWQYHGCRYDKGSRTCAESDHIDTCPVPKPHLRNGRLNQTAMSF